MRRLVLEVTNTICSTHYRYGFSICMSYSVFVYITTNNKMKCRLAVAPIVKDQITVKVRLGLQIKTFLVT